VNKSDRADAYLTVYVICGMLRCLIDDLVTATMHEKLAPLSLAIEPEINVNSSNSTENSTLTILFPFQQPKFIWCIIFQMKCVIAEPRKVM